VRIARESYQFGLWFSPADPAQAQTGPPAGSAVRNHPHPADPCARLRQFLRNKTIATGLTYAGPSPSGHGAYQAVESRKQSPPLVRYGSVIPLAGPYSC
jgi:hypothetical protein